LISFAANPSFAATKIQHLVTPGGIEAWFVQDATVPLVALAYGRSGDKGDNANIGIFARKPEYVPILDSEVTEDAVAQYFAHRINGKVTRWRLPGIGGFNFLLRQALGGGGMASLKADPLAKAFAQMLLDMPVKVPAEMARKLAT